MRSSRGDASACAGAGKDEGRPAGRQALRAPAAPLRAPPAARRAERPRGGRLPGAIQVRITALQDPGCRFRVLGVGFRILGEPLLLGREHHRRPAAQNGQRTAPSWPFRCAQSLPSGGRHRRRGGDQCWDCVPAVLDQRTPRTGVSMTAGHPAALSACCLPRHPPLAALPAGVRGGRGQRHSLDAHPGDAGAEGAWARWPACKPGAWGTLPHSPSS